MSLKMTGGITVKITDREGQRYIRVADMADVLRGLANALEPAVVVDAREIADGLRKLARDLEIKVASAELAPL